MQTMAKVSIRPRTPLPLRIYLCFLEPGWDLLDGLVQFLDQCSLPMAFTLSSYGVLILGRVRKPLEPCPETPEAILDEFCERLGIQRECKFYDTPQRLEPIVGESKWNAWEAQRQRPRQERQPLPFTFDGDKFFHPFVIEPLRWLDPRGNALEQPVVVSYIQGGRTRTMGDCFYLFACGRLRAAEATTEFTTDCASIPSAPLETTTSPNGPSDASQLGAFEVQVGMLSHGSQVASPGVRVAFAMAVADDLGNGWMHVARICSGSSLLTAVRQILEKREIETAVVLGCNGHVRDIQFQQPRGAPAAGSESTSPSGLFADGAAFLIESLQGCYDARRDGAAAHAQLHWVLTILDDREWRDALEGRREASVPLLSSYAGIIEHAICDGDVELTIAQVLPVTETKT